MPSASKKIFLEFGYKRIVRWKEIVSLLGDEVKATTVMQWLLKSRKAIAVRKGLYFLKWPNEWLLEEIEVNPLIVAGNLHPNGIIGYHSAFKCYGVAHSESNVFQVALPKSVKRVMKPFNFQQARYEFFRTDLSFGITSSVIDDVRLKHFSRERILLEGLKVPDRFLGIHEFLMSLEGFLWIDFSDLMSILSNYPATTICMRLGWLLESYRERWNVSDSILKILEKNRTESRIYLLKKQTKGNYLVKRWNLMVPKTLEDLSEV